MNVTSRNVHPFPARMAPSIALDKIGSLSSRGSVILDPMCGSGTVPRLASVEGRHALASDLDPLAVLMTRVACSPALSAGLERRARRVIDEARKLEAGLPAWVVSDDETLRFVDYWFAPPQQDALSRLARILAVRTRGDDALRLALSRLIITKSGGASLARDTSHSRPHRVAENNEFDVYEAFVRSAAKVEGLVAAEPPDHAAVIRRGDARSLSFVRRGSVDLVVTSPPYLNAIDYLRGHRMTLVWLGWTVRELRMLRGDSIGAERALPLTAQRVIKLAEAAVPRVSELSAREAKMVWRFARDMERLASSMSRVIRPGGHLVFVVADSQLKGVPVSNSDLAVKAAEQAGFALVETVTRPLPMSQRYLPPPESGKGSLATRMREEVIVTFRR